MILLELLKKGQFPIHIESNEINYSKINYTVLEEKTVQFKISPAQNNSQSNPAQISELKLQLLKDFTAFQLQENIHYIINGLDTITLTGDGYEKLQQQKSNNNELAEVLATPQKIMALAARVKNEEDNDDDNEIDHLNNLIEKTKILKDILDKKDSHLLTVGSLGRTNLCFHAKEEYQYIHEELFKALRIALADLASENSAHPLVIEDIVLEQADIEISISRFIEPNGGIEAVNMRPGPALQQLINGITRSGKCNDEETDDNSNLLLEVENGSLEDTDFNIISAQAIRIKPSGYSKLKKVNVDLFFRRESDILTKTIPLSNGGIKLNLQHLHTKAKTNTSNTRSKHKSLYLSDINNTLRNGVILALKKTELNDVCIAVTDSKLDTIDSLSISKNNHVSLLHVINKILLISELVQIILNIKTHPQKINAFSKNGTIINAFKRHTDIYNLDTLFHILLDNQSDIDIHLNPTKDRFSFWHNTDSWQQLIGEIREYAYQQVVQKVSSLEKSHAIDLINSCLRKSIFITHRSNNILNWLHSTETVKKLEKLLDEVNKRPDPISNLVRLT